MAKLMNVELKRIRKTVYIVTALLLAAVVILFWLLTRSFVTITLSPRTATFWLDNTEIKPVAGEVKINTSVGNHMIRVESDGYTGQNIQLSFGRGFNKKVDINLAQTPRPVTINNNSTLLTKGTNFNDGYYLANNTIYKLKVGLDEQNVVTVLENRPVSQAKVSDTQEIIWSPSKDLAILRHSSRITLFDFMKYDFINQTESPWGGSDIGSIAWAPDNSRIAYSYAPTSGERSLIFANITNTQIERVLNFTEAGIENPTLRWSPDSEWLLIIPHSKDQTKNKIYLFNAYTRKLKTAVEEGGQVDASFSPDNNKIVYATKSSGNLSDLYLMDKNGDNKKKLNVEADPETISWTNDSKNIIIANTDQSSSVIYEYNIDLLAPLGFEITGLDAKIGTIMITDDSKLLLYESNNNVYAIKVN